MTGIELAIAASAAAGAGFVNALAGGGTLISFPALTAIGVPPIAANITNTVALCPGFLGGMFSQRADFRGQTARLKWLVPAGAVGGIGGGLLLLYTDERVFRSLVPFLILTASLLLAAQEPLRAALVRRGAARSHAAHAGGVIALPIAGAAIYGGYFGAGLGVILLACLGLLIDDSLTRLNALKQAISFAANAAAASIFVGSGQVLWQTAAVMAAGALAGGAIGGRLASAINPRLLRRVVVLVGVVISIVYFVR